jgi:hypothetical protein
LEIDTQKEIHISSIEAAIIRSTRGKEATELTTLDTRRQETDDEGSLTARIRELIAPLLAERDQLVAKRDDLRTQVRETDSDLTRVDRMLKAAGYTAPKQPTAAAKKKPPGALAPGPLVMNETMAKVIKFVAEAKEPVTTRDTAEEIGIARGHAQGYLKKAREAGWISTAGKRRSESGGREMHLYAGFPDTLKRLEKVQGNGG